MDVRSRLQMGICLRRGPCDSDSCVIFENFSGLSVAVTRNAGILRREFLQLYEKYMHVFLGPSVFRCNVIVKGLYKIL